METLYARFKRYEKPNLGSIPTLMRAVRGMKYKKSDINLAFKKFVVSGEFDPSERDLILEDLYHQNEEGEKCLD